MKRTFIAIDIPICRETKEIIQTFSNRLEINKIKWLKEDNLHLTLKFLGDTDETLIESIGAKLMELANQSASFSLTVKNTGIFKSMANPTIIWIGIEESEPLSRLKSLIDTELIEFGYPTEQRKFTPHLTIGRIKSLKDKKTLQQLIQEFQHKVFLHFQVAEIIFYESILSYNGPQYIKLGNYPLKNSV